MAALGQVAWRSAAGGATATAAVCVGLTAVVGRDDGGELLPLLGLVAGAGVVCTALSVGFEARSPSGPGLLRYGLLGAVAAGAGALALGGVDAYLALVLLVAVPIGTAAGVLAAAVARSAPPRALLPLASAGLLATVSALVLAWLGDRPPHPGSYLVVTGPSSAEAALPLAQDVARRLEAQDDPGSDAAWSSVAGRVVQPGEGGRVQIGYARADPSVRRITVDVEGDLACVTVHQGDVQAGPGGCTD